MLIALSACPNNGATSHADCSINTITGAAFSEKINHKIMTSGQLKNATDIFCR